MSLTRRVIPHPVSVDRQSALIREAPRETPVRATASVLVVDGGPAGVGAALAAASEGARTMLVERHGMLGGMWTAGLVNPFFEAQRGGWLVPRLIAALEQEGAWAPWRYAFTFEAETMRRVLEGLLCDAGVEFLYHSLCVEIIVEGDRVRGVIIESKAGREAILADVVIDCTGDGDVAARGGAPFELGRDRDGLMQPMTLMFELEGTGQFSHESAPELFDRMTEALAASGLGYELPFGRVGYVPWVIALPRPGAAAVQLTHVYRLNALKPEDVTRGTVKARRQIAEALEILRRIPGLEGIRLAQSAAHIGVRESRRILGHYQLCLDDLARGARFEDAVATCGFGVDIHEPAPGAGVPSGHGATMHPYEIPYRCLVPRDVKGLLVAGRCISGTHEAHASYRVTGTCMATGQAAGLAAAQAVAADTSPDRVSGSALRQALTQRGVRLLEG